MIDWKKIEAVLFASGRYLSQEELIQLSGLSKKDVTKSLKEIEKHYNNGDSALRLFEQDGKYKLNVKENYTDLVRNVMSEAELPANIMATLAIISYKTPILQAEVIDARGSGAYEHIKVLEEKGFVMKEKYGRTYKIKLAEKFFEYFDIEGDGDIREIFKEVKKPDPEKLGKLKVYESNESSDEEFAETISDRMQKLTITDTDNKMQDEFLSKMDEKITSAKSRIDEAENDLSEYKRTESEDEDKNAEEPLEEESDSKEILKKVNDEINDISGQEDDDKRE